MAAAYLAYIDVWHNSEAEGSCRLSTHMLLGIAMCINNVLARLACSVKDNVHKMMCLHQQKRTLLNDSWRR